MPTEIDWPLTLSWLALGVSAVSALFAGWATRYTRLAYRLQEKQHAAAPTGIEVSDSELFVLRLVDDEGPLVNRSYLDPPNIEVSYWSTGLRPGHVVHDTPGNQWFRTAIERLQDRELVTSEYRQFWGSTFRLTENGRVVVRKEAGRKLKDVPAFEWVAVRHAP